MTETSKTHLVNKCCETSTSSTKKETISGKRKRIASDSVCMTRQKRKLIETSGKRDPPQKTELINFELLDSNTRKYLFTSSLGLVSTSEAFSNGELQQQHENGAQVVKNSCEQPDALLSPSGKSDTIFTCNVCEQIFDSEQRRMLHQRKHSKCKFCNKTLRTWREQVTHFKTNCYLDLRKSLPFVKLSRIDEDKQTVSKYPDSFGVKTINNKIKIVEDDFETTLKEEELCIVDNQSATDIQQADIAIELHQCSTVEIEKSKLCNGTDGSSKSAETPNVLKNHEKNEKASRFSSSLVVNGISSHNVGGLNEKVTILEELFNKHSKRTDLKDASCVQLLPCNSNIVKTASNAVIYQGLYKQLDHYKVPLHFVKRNSLCTNYIEILKPTVRNFTK